ncbi:type II toxin-antitoxin system VapC family toxin [Pseudonocardia sp. CA-107938]|uniref:type II toxin-antitoxin system VapC family toxin n=1 Tax=Pseudonocardia sp. CA-107938 TaxID=3240021 RepID=UPI003D904B87
MDTSALIKLVIAEDESVAVDRYLDGADMLSSSLLVVEARRSILRRAPDRLPQMDIVLTRVGTAEISAAIIESASRLPDPMLRSLDAIHLATALMVRDDLTAVLTYDDRLATAAASHGLTVESPA